MAGAGEVLRARSVRGRSETTASIGMIAFLASWAMLFAGLFFAFGMARARAHVWPPPDLPALPLWQPLINTLVIFASSAAYVVGLRAIRNGDAQRLATMMLLTLLGGLAFVGLQLDLWADMWRAGLRPSSGQYGALFYMLTWVHAAHIAVGLIAVAWLTFRAFGRAFSPERHLTVRMWSHYWHFVGVVWVLMFLMLFVS